MRTLHVAGFSVQQLDVGVTWAFANAACDEYLTGGQNSRERHFAFLGCLETHVTQADEQTSGR